MGKFYSGISDELILYVRQWAWLNAIPIDKNKPKSNLQSSKKIKEEKKSRAEKIKDRGEDLPLPWLKKEITYLIDYFWDMGPTLATAMGASPLTQSEIHYWQLNNVELSPWEAGLMRRLSIAYLSQSQRSEEDNEPQPWITKESIEKNREDVGKRLSMTLGGLIESQEKNGRNLARSDS